MIPSEYIDQVKENNSCADILIRNGVQVDRYGKALCPFHNDKGKSFNYYKKNNTCHCFGCGWDGDVIRLEMAFTGLTFVEAYKVLGGRVEAPNRAENERLKAKQERLSEWKKLISEVERRINELTLAVMALSREFVEYGYAVEPGDIDENMIAMENRRMRLFIEIENYKDTLQKLNRELRYEKSK